MWILIIIVPLFIWLDLRLFNIYYNFIFSNEDDFNDSLGYTFTPNIFSLFRGEYLKDIHAEFKLKGFIFLCIVTIVIEVLLVKGLINIL